MKNKLIAKVESSQSKPNLPEISIGDTVEVYVRIREGNKERIQLYEGLVISARGQGTGKTIRVRKISYGIGVERVFLVHSPIVSDIKVLKSNKVRRSKLYYMRNLRGKASRLKEKKK